MAHTSNLLNPASEHGDSDPRGPKRVADYLRRYPDISDQEQADLVGGFRQLSNLDIAFMLSNPDVAPKLERFRAEHRRDTRPPFRDYAALLAIVVATFVIIVYSVAVAS
jgi:hypothetical protein